MKRQKMERCEVCKCWSAISAGSGVCAIQKLKNRIVPTISPYTAWKDWCDDFAWKKEHEPMPLFEESDIG